MAGLLNTIMGDTPERSQQFNLLMQGLAQRNGVGGLLAANQYAGQAPERKRLAEQQAMQMQLLQSQVSENTAQAQERQAVVRAKQAEAERQAGIQRGLPGLFTRPGMTGGEPIPQEIDGVPMFNQPMSAAPMQRTPGGFDIQRAVTELRMTPAEAKAYAELAQFGKPKVARTIEIMRNGKPTTIQVDESGQEVGSGYEQWKAPLMQGLGNRTAAIDPVTLKERGSFALGQSPDSVASNQLGWANNALSRRGQDMTDARSRETNSAGKVPAGYRLAANGQGLEFIPGGPADPNAAKKAAPTEFQGKAGMFGNRAAQADKIITGLDGKYSPSAVNAKGALGGVWAVGGALEAGANAMLSDSGQKAEQAQRDFVNAVLRLESGAAIAETEFANAKKQYFPQPFDSTAVKAQKAENRKMAIQGLQDNARHGGGTQAQNTGGASGSWDKNDPLGLRK